LQMRCTPDGILIRMIRIATIILLFLHCRSEAERLDRGIR
jgi:hypothetical protein